MIGNNVNLSQFTTIGANGGRQAAEIGDNVYIGPNVCIIEHVKIGNNATIGAGSVVTKDIPENATAVGNYAKVISMNNPVMQLIVVGQISKRLYGLAAFRMRKSPFDR